MIQREVQDQNNTKWQCAQAYAGVASETAKTSGINVETDNGKVTVVCTPSGGAQTVRLELDKDWNTAISDDELLKAIQASS